MYLHSDENHNDILREATELVEHGDALEDEPEINVRRRTSAVGQHTDRTSHLRQREHAVKYFWTHHIAVTVSHTDCRDHFGMNRTIFFTRIYLFSIFLSIKLVPLFSFCLFVLSFDSHLQNCITRLILLRRQTASGICTYVSPYAEWF